MVFGSGEEANIVFQNGSPCSHLGFPNRTILATFDLQVMLILLTKFQVNAINIDFQDGHCEDHLGLE